MKITTAVLFSLFIYTSLWSEVVLTFDDPKTFGDFEYSQTRRIIPVEFFKERVETHLQKALEKTFPKGAVLKIHFMDIDLAGGFEPWQRIPLNDVRMLKDRYPPSVKFRYVLENENGNRLAEGEVSLRDTSYLLDSTRIISSTDTFHYERRMIEHWIRSKLPDLVEKKT